ncbi:MAG: class IV adenylate cyclase [archaeon]|nr:class IV adenylate cyclase [archaeon]
MVKLLEIEAKILEIDKKDLETKLRRLGAKKTRERKVESQFFDFSKNSLRKKGTILRLRLDGKKAMLAVKKKKGKASLKELDEFEVEVSDFKETRRMLSLIGLKEKSSITKKRTSFKLGRTGIEIDKISGIPYFAEIEAPSEKQVVAMAKKLGFSKKQLLSWSMFDVLRHYKKK